MEFILHSINPRAGSWSLYSSLLIPVQGREVYSQANREALGLRSELRSDALPVATIEFSGIRTLDSLCANRVFDYHYEGSGVVWVILILRERCSFLVAVATSNWSHLLHISTVPVDHIWCLLFIISTIIVTCLLHKTTSELPTNESLVRDLW